MTTTVLLCDDAMFTRMMLKGILVEAGFEVVGEAGTGRQAVTLYEELRPDLVLMDMIMPDLSGLDAVREIRRTHPGANIVMCSAMGQEVLMQEAIGAGARGFIVKPFTKARVLEAIEEAVNA